MYDVLKPKYPTLYKSSYNNSIYVEIIKKDKYKELLNLRNECIKNVLIIDSILEELNKDILKDLEIK